MKNLLLVLAMFALSAPCLAGDNKVVLQISDDTVKKQVLVLNVADNLVNHYGEGLELEIVAFGPGLNLFSANTANSQRLDKLYSSGVKLSACQNTAAKMSQLRGKDIALHQHVDFVNGGVARIVELVAQGYILIRP